MKSLMSTARGLTVLLAVGALTACELPTGTPILEQEWIFPLSSFDVGVQELLPTWVSITEDTAAFTFVVDGTSFDESLGDLCPGCQGLDGLTVPKPAFQGDFEETFPLPDDVQSAVVQNGEVEVVAQNGFGFDPLRPPGGQTGTATLTLREGGPTGPVLDELVLNGTDTSFGPGTILTRTLDYSGPVIGSLSVTLTIDSPAGGPEPGNWVPIRLNDELQVVVSPGTVEVTSANITVAGRAFALPITGLDVEDLDADLVEQVSSGFLRLIVQNPWSVGATLNLAITGPTMAEPIFFIARVPPTPTATLDVEFTASDLQAFLGQPDVVVAGQGTVDQSAGAIPLLPDQVMTIETKLDLTIEIG